MFHQNLTSGSLSRLYLSSKSFPGVWEDWDVLGGAGDVSGYSKYPREALLKVSSRSIGKRLSHGLTNTEVQFKFLYRLHTMAAKKVETLQKAAITQPFRPP